MACCSSCAQTGGSCGDAATPAPYRATLAGLLGELPEIAPLGSGCGSKYADRMVASGGRTEATPCAGVMGQVVCSGHDAEAWYLSAQSLAAEVRQGWNALVWGEHEIGDYSESRSLRIYVTHYEEEWAAIRDTWAWTIVALDYRQLIERIKANMRQGLCALERLGEAIDRVRARGSNVAPLPDPSGETAGGGGGGALIVLVVLLMLVAAGGGFAAGQPGVRSRVKGALFG